MKKYAYAVATSAVAIMFAVSVAIAGHGHEHGSKGDGEHHKSKHEHIMQKLDADSDGKISKAEFMAVHEKRFTEMDGNGDGSLTAEEMKESWAKFKKKRHEKRMEMKKDGDAPAGEEKTEDAGDSDSAE